MKIKIGILLIALIVMCSFAGCVTESENPSPPDDINSGYVGLYVDEYTGVEYLIYDGYYSGGICPRYNADGTLKINEKFMYDN